MTLQIYFNNFLLKIKESYCRIIEFAKISKKICINTIEIETIDYLYINNKN